MGRIAGNGFCGQKRVEKVSQKKQNITLSRAIKLHESERARWRTGKKSAGCDQDGTRREKEARRLTLDDELPLREVDRLLVRTLGGLGALVLQGRETQERGST